MLIRLADNAIWMARYLERAESIARLVGVTQQLTLLPEYAGASEKPWIDALAVLGVAHEFKEAHGEVTPDAAAHFLLLEPVHHSSLFSCLRAARDNGRTARHLLTETYWDALNATWLSVQALDDQQFAERGIDDVCLWTIQRCQQIRGASDDLIRDELPHALALGQAMERADHIARLLAVFLRGSLADPKVSVISGTPVYRRWEAILTAASLEESYRRTHSAIIDPELALRLVLTHPTSPRSLVVNLERIESNLVTLFGESRIPEGLRNSMNQLREHLADATDGALLTADVGTYLVTLTRLTDEIGSQVVALIQP